MKELQSHRPFGDPNANLRSDIEETYIDISEILDRKQLNISDIRDTRIVVGRKGSGKTHLLLHIKSLSDRETTLCEYVPIDSSIFGPTGIHGYRGSLTAEQSTLLWSDVWRLSFLISALSNFSCKRPTSKAKKAISASVGRIFDSSSSGDHHKTFVSEIFDSYPQIAWQSRYPMSPINAFNEITKRYTHLQSFDTDLFRAININDLMQDISVLLHHFGPIHYIIDGLDEIAWVDPVSWLDIQRGLFKFVFLFTTLQNRTQYIRVTVAVRNYVYNRSVQDSQADRVNSHVVKLN